MDAPSAPAKPSHPKRTGAVDLSLPLDLLLNARHAGERGTRRSAGPSAALWADTSRLVYQSPSAKWLRVWTLP